MKLDTLAAAETINRWLEANGNRSTGLSDLVSPFTLAKGDTAHGDPELSNLQLKVPFSLTHFLGCADQFAVGRHENRSTIV